MDFDIFMVFDSLTRGVNKFEVAIKKYSDSEMVRPINQLLYFYLELTPNWVDAGETEQRV